MCTVGRLQVKGHDVGEGGGIAASEGRSITAADGEELVRFESASRCEMFFDEWWEHVHTYIVRHCRNLRTCVCGRGVYMYRAMADTEV